jgi:hypothetical protein
MTVDVGSAHLRVLAQSPGLISFGAWLEDFYAGLAARYAGRAPIWDSEEPRIDPTEVVKQVEEARVRWLGADG